MSAKMEAEETKVSELSEDESSELSPDRDFYIVSHINQWMPNFLPPGFEHLTKWDVFESIHCDDVTVVEVGATVYGSNGDSKKQKKAMQTMESELQSFLADSDDSDNEDTSATVTAVTTTQPSKSQPFIPEKIESFRLVLQFDDEMLLDDSNDEMPQCIAVYYKQNKKWNKKYVKTEKFDPELHPICVAEELNDVEESDISTLLAPLSKKQIVLSITSFLAKKPQHSKLLELKKSQSLSTKQIRSELNNKTRDELELICVRLVCADDDIIDEFSSHVEDEMRDCMDDFQSAVFEGNLEPILDSLSEVLKTAKSMRESEHIYSAIKTMSQMTKQWIAYLRKCCSDVDDDDNDDDNDGNSGKIEIWSRNELLSNGKLNFLMQTLEELWEKMCKNCELDRKGKSTLESLLVNMSGWKDDISPVLGPIFSDNIRTLQKRLRKTDLDAGDDLKMPPAKKRRIN